MSFAWSISKRNREKKYKYFLDKLNPSKDLKILDVGFNDEEPNPAENYLEKNYPWPGQITALGIDEPNQFLKRYPKVKAISYDGEDFPFEDQVFDICWSNAVIEHVGTSADQLYFLKEIKRVSKRAFITTPNKYFPIEVHSRIPFLHFLLPQKWLDKFVRLIKRPWADSSNLNLLTIRDIRKLLKDADIDNYEIKSNRFFGFILDYVITF